MVYSTLNMTIVFAFYRIVNTRRQEVCICLRYNKYMIIPSAFFNLVVYLYPNLDDATSGSSRNGGGTGFLYGMDDGNKTYLYVVTNAHILEGLEDQCAEQCIVRINTKSGGAESMPTLISDWHRHPNNDDLAVYLISEPKDTWRYEFITNDMLLDEDFVRSDIFSEDGDPAVAEVEVQDDGIERKWRDISKVGIGMDTVMIGRFIKHGGSGVNYPVVRRGHIAMLPFEKIKQSGRNHEQEGFLVETYSIGGFSGSPVFVQTAANKRHKKHDGTGNGTTYEQRVFLLGVDWGHFDFDGEVIPTDATKIKVPSGMMCVVPSWKLTDLIDSEAVKAQRSDGH